MNVRSTGLKELLHQRQAAQRAQENMCGNKRLLVLSALAFFHVDRSCGFVPHAAPSLSGNSYSSYTFNLERSPFAATTQGAPSSRLLGTVAGLRGGSPASPGGNGRGGSVAMVAGGEVAAATLDVLRSATAHVPLSGPALFAQVNIAITWRYPGDRAMLR